MKPTKRAEEMTVQELAAYIDQSVLKPEFTQEEIKRYIGEGIALGCATVCINPASLPLARKLCAGTKTGICVVCDFPFGTSGTASKTAQAQFICQDGGIQDLDVVTNYGWMRSGMWQEVSDEIAAVAEVCHRYGTQLKAIIETDALTLDEVAKATEAVIAGHADFVKTSTGFFTGARHDGASVEVVRRMLEVAHGRCKVKGAGGIRDRKHFLELIDMGIDRMGIGYRSTPVVLGIQ